jgi:cell division protein ZapA (FtsZ GTPase activity inhibitor)
MVDYVQNNQPFCDEEKEALLEILTDELDEVYKEIQEYSEIRSDLLKAK